ncbi:MAG: hypothetical protein HY665_05790 [Chloroflexi bacterium]|nr:hypothetical protein [Chloroflexota bacterium]
MVFVGVQHAWLARDLKDKSEILTAMAVAIPGLITSNLAIGLASGMCLHFVLKSLPRSRAVRSYLRSVVGRSVGFVPDRVGKASPIIPEASHLTSPKRDPG